MYLSGSVIKMNYITDNGKTAIVKPHSVGLTVISVSAVHGGTIQKDMSHAGKYNPIPVHIDTDTGKKFYRLGSGSYLVVFEQGISKLPKDAIASLEGNDFTKYVGSYFVGNKYFEYEAKGNLSGILIIPENCSLSLEVGSSIADLYIQYEKFEEV